MTSPSESTEPVREVFPRPVTVTRVVNGEPKPPTHDNWCIVADQWIVDFSGPLAQEYSRGVTEGQTERDTTGRLLYQTGYQVGLDDALASLPEGKDILTTNAKEYYTSAGWNVALDEARAAILKK